MINKTKKLFMKTRMDQLCCAINDKIAGTGSLFITDGIAEIGIAATSDDARGKGVQTALIHFRENRAYVQGCRYLFVETAEPTPSYSAPSY